jgi:Ca2+-binding EF-hand superfamily protein
MFINPDKWEKFNEDTIMKQHIDFKEFVKTMGIILHSKDQSEKLRKLYDMYDVNGNG